MPNSWFISGQFISLIGIAWLAHATFGMPYWQSALAVVLTFALALVACRVTGETDTTPIGAMGKIMQLTFGGLAPGNMNINLMAANITAGAASSSADLLTDLKSGYLLGAHPRKQFIAQFAGIFMGTLITVFAFSVMVPNASVLGSDQFPAPAAQTWRGVAEAMALGLSHMHPVKLWSIVIGGLVGILLPAALEDLPEGGEVVAVAGRSRPCLGLPVVLRRALLHGRGDRGPLAEAAREASRGVSLPDRIGDHRGRRSHGRRVDLLGERPRYAQDPAEKAIGRVSFEVREGAPAVRSAAKRLARRPQSEGPRSGGPFGEGDRRVA